MVFKVGYFFATYGKLNAPVRMFLNTLATFDFTWPKGDEFILENDPKVAAAFVEVLIQ